MSHSSWRARHRLADGRALTIFNAHAAEWMPAYERDIQAASQESLVFVTGAENLRAPRPELAFVAWRNNNEQRKNGTWPYLCRLSIDTYNEKFGYLDTRLSPRWWSLSPAFAALKEARAAKASKGKSPHAV